MRIVTWNINGIRSYKGGIKRALDLLNADIICVQETKVTRDLLDERTAIVDGYNSYFSYSRGRSGYSGVATYCKDSAIPFSAEEGLTGLLTNHEGAVGCYGDQSGFSDEELQLLDNEGRALITKHKIICKDEGERSLTVINVYCPRADPEKPERKQFKLQFYKLLQCRAEALLKDGSHVIVLGDVNTSHQQSDHCDPSEIEEFEENPGRKWLNNFLHNSGQEKDHTDEQLVENSESESGKFIDTFRHFHPNRSNAFTCWSTLTGARHTNYGTRIDYIFADCKLAVEYFVGSDIMPEVEGSDHCPVWGKLSCSLLPSSKPPPLCTRYLPEFVGKQQKLSRFLVKVEPKSTQPEQNSILPGSQEEEKKRENTNPLSASKVLGKKRLMAADSVIPKRKKTTPQGNLLAFFKSKVCDVKKGDGAPVVDEVTSSQASCDSSSAPAVLTKDTEVVRDASSRLCSHTDRPETDMSKKTEAVRPTREQSQPKKETSVSFWKSVLQGPPPPPSCKVHGEPCVLRTVKKVGPNMGKQFFVCARPQGHASNPEARCNFFSWVDKEK